MAGRQDDEGFQDALGGLMRGDFTRLAPLCEGEPSPIVRWHAAGRFSAHASALDEALSCASFNGALSTVEYLLAHGVNPEAGRATGLNAFHWAANRGQREVVGLLIRHGAPLESRNMYDATVLGTAVWSAINEPKPDHLAIIGDLIEAGADRSCSGFPTGVDAIDALLRRPA